MAVFSPDGRQIAFVSGRNDEIRLMGPKGDAARRLAGASANEGFLNVAWSPDGTRLACLKFSRMDFRDSTVELHELRGGAPSALLSQARITALAWTTDNRLLYAQGEPPPQQESYSLWDLQLDPRTAQPVGAPRRLASWLSQSVSAIGVSRDGQRVMVTRGRTRSNVLIGQLSASGAGLSDVRPLTQDDRVNYPSSWMPDGRSVLFHSDRNGDFDLFRQGFSDREAQPLLLGPDEARSARLSPDGRWILYLALADPDVKTGASRVRLMRMPVSGGPPEPILDTTGNWGRGESIVGVDGDYVWTFPDFRCPAAPPTAPCVIGEASGHAQTSFTAFDPVGGRKAEVARAEVPPAWLAWDLSADGSRLAYSSFGYFTSTAQPVHVLTLADKTLREVPLKNWPNPTGVAWSPSADSLFVTNWAVRGGALLSVDLTGRVRVLRDLVGKGLYLADPRPSPDGRSLAFSQATAGSNTWVLESRQK
jgi:dipeptidyl aminopeptidase/acylaminoacyl peptidase